MPRISAYRTYLLAQATDGFAWSMIVTLNMVYLVTVVDLDPFRLVLVGTTLEVAYFLFEIPTGVVADVYSRKWSVVIGFALVGLGFVIEGTFPIFEIVLISQVLFGVGATFTSGAYEAWIAAETQADRARDGTTLGEIYLRGQQANQVAAFVGIGAAVLLGRSDVSVPIVIGGSALVVLAAFLALFMPEVNFHRAPRASRHTWRDLWDSTRKGFDVIRGKRALWLVVIVMVIWGGAAEGFDRLWTIHLIENYDLPLLLGIGLVGWFGIIRAGGMIITIGGAELARRRLDTENDRSLALTMLVLTVLISGFIVLLAFAPGFIVGVVAVWAIFGARQILDPLVTTWVNRHSEERVRATVLSGVRQSESLGEIAIGPVMGWLATVRTITFALTSSALVLLATTPLWRKASRGG